MKKIKKNKKDIVKELNGKLGGISFIIKKNKDSKITTGDNSKRIRIDGGQD